MDKNYYLNRLTDLYSYYHDVKTVPNLAPFPLDIYAHFYQSNQKYFGSRNVSLWRVNNEEHCFVKYYEKVDNLIFDEMIMTLKKAVVKLVTPNPDHMKTAITGVAITEKPPGAELVSHAKKFSYKKPYMFYLHGWSEIRFLLIDLSSKQVICNSAGKEVKKFYEGLFSDGR
ncbi:MAG: hypothetical protein APF76_17375 [Desulfitibacter sp. BRH_c19]|nr:MAG: hypothetical protein APF76_17375 [Desulfitibacter sp. BRH_c19]